MEDDNHLQILCNLIIVQAFIILFLVGVLKYFFFFSVKKKLRVFQNYPASQWALCFFLIISFVYFVILW